jgi:hypothetical protein
LVATGGSPSFVTINATNVIASANSNAAVFTSGLGNATAPAYSFTGDTNTGIFSPTADTIAFTEGGAESMRINSAGDVLVGGTTAIDGGVGVQVGNTSAGNAKSTLQLLGNTNSWVQFGNGLSGANRYLGWVQYNYASNYMTFATDSTERMRIASDGTISTTIGSTLYGAYPSRAWVNFNGTSTVAIRQSRNVSSITDNGNGDYTVNFTQAMPDAEYSVVGTGQRNNANQVITSIFGSASYNSLTTTTARIATRDEAGTAVDSIAVCVTIHR